MFKIIAKQYHTEFGFNVLPLVGKVPTVKWEEWQSKRQTAEDLEAMDWNSSTTGIGVVMGINGLRCIDIDGIENPEMITELINHLGLPSDYAWLIQSGSGSGYHIYFRSSRHNPLPMVEENLLDRIGGEKAVFKLNMKEEGVCHHLELRWKDCQTALPPSKHPSGGVYNFLHIEPKEIPETVEIEKVISYLQKHCETEKKKNSKANKEIAPNAVIKKKYYDEETLKSCVLHLSTNLPAGSYDEWVKCGFGFASLGEEGYQYFKEMSLNNKHYNDSESEIRKKFNDLQADYDGRITLGTVYRIAEIYGWRKPFLKFWDTDDQGKVKISRTKFKRFLEREGFFKIKKDTQYLYVRSENNIVEEFDTVYVKDYVLNQLHTVSIEEFEGTNRAEIIDALMKGAGQYFMPTFFEFLITKEIEFQRDSKDVAYVFFRNGVVEVTKDAVNVSEYRQLDKYIWRRQIIDGEFHPSSVHTDFEDFQFNVCNKDQERLRALKTGMGYLLHNYKDSNQAKAIIFIDEKLSEGAFGRSGKGLVIKAIGKMRSVVTEDGRNFDVGKNFAFQRVSADTHIISIEDMRERFPFDKLFSILTEGITIEKKNRDEMYIQFSESPKVVISTNYSIKGVDDSTLDRQYLIEFSDHYNKYNRPVYEFGKLFFEDWNKEEWNAFYSYMIKCLQLYLANGLMPYTYVNLERKRLIDETCNEFSEFSDGLILNQPYNKKELFEKFTTEYPEVEKINQSRFTRWIKIFARIKSVEVVESKSGATRMIELKGLKEAA